jgi:putative peptide zinc metalloprotease protein
MKAFHELAHCYALRRFGGQVREFGIMLLIFFPVPYVEASEATALPDKRARMLVAAAGILAELLIASIALILWLQIEPGVERAILFNFVVIGSVSTLLFNGNPLLKFDAYFVLADLIEMPNLAQRSGEFLQDRFLSTILGLRREVWPPRRDARILATYGVLSVAYRLLLTLTIALLVSTWFFVIGILLAIWAVLMGVGWPLAKLYRKGVRMVRSQNRRRRVLFRLTVFSAVVVALVTAVPLPFSAPGEGRILPVPGAVIAAHTSGFVTPAEASDGARVGPGERVMRLANPDQTARLTTVRTNVEALEEELTRSGLTVAERQRVERELDVARAALTEAEARQDALVVRAPIAGRLSWQTGRTAPAGSFVFRGDRLGHVVAADALEVIVAIPVAYSGRAGAVSTLDVRLPDGSLVQRRVDRARVIDVGQPVPPGLLALTGGPIPEQPDNPGMALDSRWILWAAPDGDLSEWSGARVQARIDLGTASLFAQLRFHIQRLFLRVNRF